MVALRFYRGASAPGTPLLCTPMQYERVMCLVFKLCSHVFMLHVSKQAHPFFIALVLHIFRGPFLCVQEYLAFSSEPVTLEDIMHISGHGLAPSQRQSQPVTEPSRRQEKLQSKSNEPKVHFLQTWESSNTGSSSLHRSIHHFCTESSIPQLPIPLQVTSRQAHANPMAAVRNYDSLKDGSTTEKSDTPQKTVRDMPDVELICPPPNSPYAPTRTTSLTRTQQTPVKHQSVLKKADVQQQTLESRPSTVGMKCTSHVDDDIIQRARSQLEKELRGECKSRNETTNPSTSKLRERRIKQKPVADLRGDKKQMTLGGSRMKVAQDPAK